MKPTILASQALTLLLLVVAVGLAFLYAYFYRREAQQARRLTPRQKRLLWMLRIGAAIMAVLAIARPALTVVQTQKRLPVVAMVMDESASMAFPDARENPLVQAAPREQRTRFDTAQSAADLLQKDLTLTHRVKMFLFSDMLRLYRELPFRGRSREPALNRADLFEKAGKPAGDYTNVGDALADALRTLSDDKIAGIVLFTDGRQTGGMPLQQAMEQAARAKVPVHTVVLGTEFPLRDLRIDDVIVDPEGSVGDALIFDVKLNNQIQEQLSTTLSLEEEGKPVASKRVTLKRGENRVPLAMIPETEGTREFRIKVPAEPDEVNTENNEAVVHVKIVKRTLKVLLIASHPSREYFYLVPALLRDPVVQISCWLQNADVDYIQQGSLNIKRLPADLPDWQAYDVAILYDADPNKLTTQQINGIENMVRKGGGLLIIAGRNHGLAKFIQVHAVKMRDLLPVEIDKNALPNYFDVFEKGFDIQRTAKGKGHPILLISSDEKQNEEIWKTFPQMYWAHPVVRTKPNAIVLLEKKNEGGALGSGQGGDPIMVIQRFGEGAVFYSGINSLWRWRFPYESYDYDRFWLRVIRYLGETRLRGTQQQVSLDTEQNTYAPGEEVRIRLRVLDPALMAQLQGAQVFASVTTQQKDEQMLPLKPDSNGQMLYSGLYRARRVGSTMVHCRQAAPGADSEAKPIFDVKHAFQVKMQSLEQKDTSGDLQAMRTLAQRTGGRYFDYKNMQELASVVAAIPKEQQILRKSVLVEIWDGTGFLLVFLILIGGEWSLRKWWGLL
jgi:uncharacterized membrane protein